MFNELLERYPALESCKDEIKKAALAIIDCYERGGKVMLCGNGGSCADCDHIVGELMKGFLLRRPMSEDKKSQMKDSFDRINEDMLTKLQCGLPAISLPSITALNSAFCNDVDPELIYAQSLFALGKRGDILIGLSTSGNAKNVNAAVEVARGLGITVIGMSGEKGGKLYENADICIRVPENETFKIQELHLPVYHYLCAEVEAHFFG